MKIIIVTVILMGINEFLPNCTYFLIDFCELWYIKAPPPPIY